MYKDIKIKRSWLKWAYMASFILLIFSSCATQKRCFEKYPPEIRTETIVRDTTFYRDTILYDTIPSEIVYDTVPLLIPQPEVEDPEMAEAETEYAIARAWVERNKIILKLEQKESVLEIRLDSVIQIKDHFEGLYQVEIHKSPPEYKIKFWDKIKYLGIGAIFGLISGMVIAIFLRR